MPREHQDAGGAKDQVARLLQLVPFLHARARASASTRPPQALGVPPQQVLADLKVLLMCGLPGGYPDDLIDVDLDALESDEGDGVIRVTNADYLARPLRLTPTEATRADRGAAGAARRAPTTPPATSSTGRSPSSRRPPTRAPGRRRRWR